MRLKQIDLKSYGNFQQKQIELNHSESDFHLIFGLNETGKSTTKQSISDTLYGPKNGPNTTAAYMVGSNRVRVGVTLEQDGKELTVIRKTGNRNTLLDAQERPFVDGEEVLQPFLTGINQEHFNRGFSIDYESLLDGGKEMLNLNSEVGKIIFAASAFIVGLKDKLQRLSEASDEIWRSSRRAQNYPLNAVYGEIESHKESKAAHELDIQYWTELKQNKERIATERDELEARRKNTAEELASLRLVDKVFPAVKKYLAATQRLVSLDEVPEVSDEAEGQINSADMTILELTPQIDVAKKQVQDLRDQLKTLSIDELLLDNADWIHSLFKKQGEIEKAQLDSRNREKEIQEVSAVIVSRAQGIQWNDLSLNEIESRLPTEDFLNQLTNHQLEESGLKNQFKTTENQLKNIRKHVQDLTLKCSVLSDSRIDTSRFKTLLSRSQSWRELEREILLFEQRLQEKNREIRRSLHELEPYIVTEKELLETEVPSQSTLNQYELKLLELNERARELERDMKSCQDSINSLGAELAAIQTHDELVTREQLKESRLARDALWSEIHAELFGSSRKENNVSIDMKTLQQLREYEIGVKGTDKLADSLLDQVTRIYEQTRLTEEREKQKFVYDQLDLSFTRLQEEISAAEMEWQNAWIGLAKDVSTPQEMQKWLEDRERTQRYFIERDQLVEDVGIKKEKLHSIFQELEAELQRIGIEPEDQFENLSERITYIERVIRSQDGLETQISLKEEELTNATRNRDTLIEQYESDQLKLQEWGEKWETGLANAGLAVQAGLVSANNISVLRSLISDFTKLRDARHRIEAMQEDTRLFERDVCTLSEVLQRDLTERNNDQFLGELIGELERMRSKQKQRNEIEASLLAHESSLVELERQRDIARQILRDIQDVCGVPNRQELTEVLRKSLERKSELNRTREREEELLDIGSGYSLDELISRCEKVDPGEISRRILELEDEENRSVEAIEIAAGHAKENEHSLNELAMSDEAYMDDVVIENKFAQAERLAARYVRIKAQEVALDWIIERFRQENQAPIMLIAGRIFETITQGKYIELTTTENNRGVPQLLCVRTDSEGERETVKLENLSSGTRDQLFLALRFAAIEHFIDQGQVMPLIADDLLINSDDQRAKVIFGLFKELSKKTQIVFFTHHEHLVPIAKRVFGDDLSFQRLDSSD